MKLSVEWIREFVDVGVDDRRLAEDLTSIGIAVESVVGETPSTVFEMEIGTNRPDAMNHFGVSREAAAFYGAPLKPITAAEAPPTAGPVFPIEIADPEGCARYTAQIIRGVKIAPSSLKISRRLAAVDQRSINNAADASNYTLWEMGHPTHTFDLDLLQGGKIVVRRATAGETLKTLDGMDRKLSPEDLIIADAKRPVALAGVIGGFDTMITEKTRNILIESAWFDPAAVRRTAKRHGLHTDASHRFERGADFGATRLACALVAQRILESGGGSREGTPTDAVARQLDQAPILLRLSYLQRILGGSLDGNEVARILKRLGFEIAPEPRAEPVFAVRIPTWRLDVEREIDLIEEIARLHGYNKFPHSLPTFAGAVSGNSSSAKTAKMRSSLLALGYNEAVSLSFVSHEDAEAFSSSPVVELANPLSEEASLMRGSLVPGMLDMLAYNLNRGTEHVRLFEIGDVYEGNGNGTAEHNRVCVGATSPALAAEIPAAGLLEKNRNTSPLEVFLAFKGDVETLLSGFDHRSLAFDAGASEYYEAGVSGRALMDGEEVAQFGQISSDAAGRRKLRHDVYVAEIRADRLLRRRVREARYQPLPKFPAAERDFSFLFDDTTGFAKIETAVAVLHLDELRSFSPLEIFRGGSISPGQYSILLRARFQSLNRTLQDDEVAAWSMKIVDALKQLGGTQRA
jgi:phenylalanyl-tRNA synthetase beta chain